MTIKLWSETNPEVKTILCPDFGMRSWDELTEQDKRNIWQYLRIHFFSERTTSGLYFFIGQNTKYNFSGRRYDVQEVKASAVITSISSLNHLYKLRSYGSGYLNHPNLDSACYDFFRIFLIESEDVVFELLSLYARAFSQDMRKIDSESILKKQGESQKGFNKRILEAGFETFDIFAKDLNDVFLQFGLKVFLTRGGFVPRQDEKVMEDIYEPVIKYLSDSRWKRVNQILSDAFADYRKNTPQGYSGCVTNVVAAVEAYVQILVEGKTGGMKLNPIIKKGQMEGKIPNDAFTRQLFNNMDSIFAQERKETGDGHPKEEYATEKNARMLLNLAMVFIQHLST